MVTDWQSAGLVKVSVIKPVFATIEQSLVIRSMGRLAASDAKPMHKLLAQLLG
jgi:mRNA interferase MazF